MFDTPNHDYVPSSSEETSGVNKNNCTRFKELGDARKLHPRNFITAYLNVNSIRYKFDEIRELLTDRIVDLLFIAETKLDATFNDNLFSVDGYKLHRLKTLPTTPGAIFERTIFAKFMKMSISCLLKSIVSIKYFESDFLEKS
jgi:hypothetical protein